MVDKPDDFDENFRLNLYYMKIPLLFNNLKNNDRIMSEVLARKLLEIEPFVDELILNEDIIFVLSLSSDGKKCYSATDLTNTYFKLMLIFSIIINPLSPIYIHSEQINIFISCCNSINLLSKNIEWKNIFTDSEIVDRDGIIAAELFNDLVKKIRHDWRENNLQAKANTRKRDAIKRYSDYCRYVDTLFDKYPRQVVLQINLYYKKKLDKNNTIDELNIDMNHLISNKRNKPTIFNSMTGYIAKIEYDIEKQFYYRVIFFFNRLNNHEHINLAEKIGEYWIHTVTKGLGDYHKVEDKVDKTKWRQNTDLRASLNNSIKDLCLSDPFIRLKVDPKDDSKVRLIRRGNTPKTPLETPPKIPVKKRGRPRKESTG